MHYVFSSQSKFLKPATTEVTSQATPSSTCQGCPSTSASAVAASTAVTSSTTTDDSASTSTTSNNKSVDEDNNHPEEVGKNTQQHNRNSIEK